ncbi:MAG: hypothetical protein WKF58_09130 [Ilumatobacteraceae bacterium]
MIDARKRIQHGLAQREVQRPDGGERSVVEVRRRLARRRTR